MSKCIFFLAAVFLGGFVYSQNCFTESFAKVPTTNAGQYLPRNWMGDDNHTITATDARTDQTLSGSGKVITIRQGVLTIDNYSGGIGDLTLTIQRAFTKGGGYLDLKVNGSTIANTNLLFDATVRTYTIQGIDVAGTVKIEIVNANTTDDRVKIDDLSWTCYPPANTISQPSLSSNSYTVDCTNSTSGSATFTSSGTFTSGNIFSLELSDATGSFSSPVTIGTLAANGTNPSGTINFIIPADYTGGTGYRMRIASDLPQTTGNDNGTNVTITNSSPCPTPVSCFTESFANIPTLNAGSYLLRKWQGDDNYWITATDARTDQTITDKAITIRNGSLTINGVTGGIGSLTITTQRKFAGGSGNLDLIVNGGSKGTIAFSSATQTITIPVNVSGSINFKIDNSSGERVAIDDLSWTCFSNPNTISQPSLSSNSYTVGCGYGKSGMATFTSSGTFTSGNIFSLELSNAIGSFYNPVVIGTLAANGIDPSGTINFTIPADFTSGTAYRMRITSDSPQTIGGDNGTDVSIINASPCPFGLTATEGLLLNEFSNGDAGNKEYYEFVVAGKCGKIVDISGYIIDDNNGTFSSVSGYPSGSGISAGYMQLTNHLQWTTIPVGALIVIYNADEPNSSLPADDPYDSNKDSVYIIPHTKSDLLDIWTGSPTAVPPGDSSYTPTLSSQLWGPIGIANSGDAIQIRKPNGDYFFGVSYGGAGMSGGPDNTKITTNNLAQSNGYFSSGNFRNTANWNIGNADPNNGTVDETPGDYNTLDNKTLIQTMRDPNALQCPISPLPVSIVLFEAEHSKNNVILNWQSFTEQDNDYYTVKHSVNGYNFVEIDKIKGAGNSSSPIHYSIVHKAPRHGINYYQLISTDYDGTVHHNGTISILVNIDKIVYSITTKEILFPKKGDYKLYNISGMKIADIKDRSSYYFADQGIYIVVDENDGNVKKIVVP